MVGTSSFSIAFDRFSGQFDVSVDYTIPGYNDPETGEQFYETNWTLNYSDPVYSDSFGISGSGWDSGNGYISIGFPPAEDATDAVLDFNAVNWFSGVEAFARLHILNAGLAERDVRLTAGADYGDTLLFGGSGDDVLTGAGGGDLLDAGDGYDVLIGGAGNDTLDGGSGADAMEGGAGNDDYYVDDAGDVIFEVGGGGDDLVYAAISTTLGANLETLVLYANGTLNGTGNALSNSLYGNNDANVLSGLGGDDQLFGNNGSDRLFGGAGSDVLNGGRGDDRMTGGADDDAYVVDSAGDVIIEDAGGGRDEVAVDGLSRYRLGSELEDLTNLAALPSFTGIGNALGNAMTGAAGSDRLFGLGGADRLDGGDGNDLLEGGAGADRLVGGKGSDTASYAGAAVAVRVSLGGGTGTGDAAGDTFASIENLTGSRFGDTLTGNAGTNRISGGAGDDKLVGGGGKDWLVGGLGADRLSGDGNDGAGYGSSSTAVTVNLVQQTANGGDAAGDMLVGISNAQGSAQGDTLIGNTGANVLLGEGGADKIDGAGGNDTIRGGAGADTLIGGADFDTLDYSTSAAKVTVNLATGGASGGDAMGDRIAGFERLIGSAFDDTLIAATTGSTLVGGVGADTLTGGAGNDTLIGGAGGDVMDGGLGTDTLSYETSRSYVQASLTSGMGFSNDAQGDTFTGFENLRGGLASDALYGNSAGNVIWGGAGGDYIDGAGGADVLIGGSGDDAFAIFGDSGADRIRDFTAGGSEDRLLISLGSDFDSSAEVLAVAQQNGANTVIDFGDGLMIVLEGVLKANLNASDFAFDI